MSSREVFSLSEMLAEAIEAIGKHDWTRRGSPTDVYLIKGGSGGFYRLYLVNDGSGRVIVWQSDEGLPDRNALGLELARKIKTATGRGVVYAMEAV